jgi:ACS family hexuronate transporter-like MFS transporter
MKQPAGKYRWTICSLIFFATTINYLDRAVISLLKSDLTKEFHWTETDYSNIVIAFQLAYAAGMLVAGRFIDKAGTKAGYALYTFLWSLAAAAHALVSSTLGFGVARAFLGISESGNFPAAIKTVAEWFPKKERAFATGIFNSGANIGAIVAPLTVPFIAATMGWKWAFIITGSIGFIWLLLWYYFYETPAKQRRLSKAEFDYIHSDTVSESEQAMVDEKTSWIKLLGYKQTWAVAIGKFLTDPVWWFYLFWLPAFLKEQYHMEGTAVALPVSLVYSLSAVGSIFGGWLPMNLIKRNWPVFKARKMAMLLYALCALPVVFSQWLGHFDKWYAVIIIGLAAGAHAAWSANIYTTVSDMFPKKMVGSVTGIGGMAGAAGGILIAALAGKLFDHFKAAGHIETGYYIMFIICGLAYTIAWAIMHLLVPKFKHISDE